MTSTLLPRCRAVPMLAAVACSAGCASIPEGRSAVDSVHIKDARSLDADMLQGKLATAASPRLFGVVRGLIYDYEIFDASVLQRDLARLERTYRGHGFFEAHARTARVIRVSPTHVRVEIVVDEGPPMLDREVRVDGLDALPPEIAASARSAAQAALPRSARFDEDAYAKARTAVERALTDTGYAHATVQSDAQADLGRHVVDYVFTVSAGPRAVLGDVKLVGPDGKNPPPEEPALRRALDLSPGQPFSTKSIEAATQALLDLDVLASVNITPDLDHSPPEVVPLVVHVEPAKLHETDLGGGLELDAIKAELHGLVRWEDHDFLGDLRDFMVELKPGVVLYPMRVDNFVAPQNPLPEEHLRLQLRQPGFVEPHTTLQLRPEMNVFPMLVQPDPPSGEPVLGYVEPKMGVTVERRFFNRLLVTAGPGVQGEIPFAYTSIPLATPIPPVVLSVFQVLATLDYRDDPLRPHSGFFLANDLQFAGGPLGGSATDVREKPTASAYVPITKKITLAARTSVGFLFAANYGDYIQNHLADALNPNSLSRERFYDAVDKDIEVALFRGFFSGGPGSNRGFPLRGIAPYGVVPFLSPVTLASLQASGASCIPNAPHYDPSKCAVPIGGFSLWEASLELRFDVSGPFGVVVFCDSGDVAAAQGTLRLDHLHLSCGAGARYDTPVGPIRLDVGYRIQPLQVLGYANEQAAAQADRVDGAPPLLGNVLPIAISFGIGETYQQ